MEEIWDSIVSTVTTLFWGGMAALGVYELCDKNSGMGRMFPAAPRAINSVWDRIKAYFNDFKTEEPQVEPPVNPVSSRAAPGSISDAAASFERPKDVRLAAMQPPVAPTTPLVAGSPEAGLY